VTVSGLLQELQSIWMLSYLMQIYPDAAWLRQHLCAGMGEEILFLWKHFSVSFYSATQWPHFPSYAAIY